MLPTSRPGPLPSLKPIVTKRALILDTDRRAQIDESLNSKFPSDLVGLIADYDISLASQPLRVDDRGNLIDSDENRAIRSAIREALLSADIDPKIKRQIFINAAQFQFQREFQILLSELRGLRVPVNLDNTDLSHLVLKGIYIDQARAVDINLSGSIIEGCNFSQVNLTNANLKGATLRNVGLFQSDLYGAQFERTQFIRCAATNLITNDTHLHNLAYMARTVVYLNGTHTTKSSHLQVSRTSLRVPLTFIPQCVIS